MVNNKYNLFYFDIKNEEYSDEIILDSSLYMSSTGLLYKTSGEYCEYVNRWYSTYEKTEYALDSEELKGSEFHNIIQSDDGVIIAGEIHSEDKAANAIIAELSIVFNIETKTDGKGTIKASATTEHSGNQVTFEITPKEGYV